jgi:hypothetical protein
VLVVIVVVSIVLAVAVPRVGRLPARVQAEYCVSAVRTALDVGSLRARTTGQACRLVLVPNADLGGGSGPGGPWWGKALPRWGMVDRRSDQIAAEDLESGTFVMEALEPDPLVLMLSGRATPVRSVAPGTADGAVGDVYGLVRDQFPLPTAVVWDPESVRAGTGHGARGPAFVFHPSGGAAGPELGFAVGKRRYRLGVDPLTGRADVRSLSRG